MKNTSKGNQKILNEIQKKLRTENQRNNIKDRDGNIFENEKDIMER